MHARAETLGFGGDLRVQEGLGIRRLPGDAAQQYALITRLLYTPHAEARGGLQNPRVVPGDVALDQACFRISAAACARPQPKRPAAMA